MNLTPGWQIMSRETFIRYEGLAAAQEWHCIREGCGRLFQTTNSNELVVIKCQPGYLTGSSYHLGCFTPEFIQDYEELDYQVYFQILRMREALPDNALALLALLVQGGE